MLKNGCAALNPAKTTNPICSTTRPWRKCSAPNCSQAFGQRDLSCRPVTQKFGWVDAKSVGSGGKVLVYLGRYLYKGVIQEKDIIACRDGLVTFRYEDSKTKLMQTRTLPGTQFLWLTLQHVLPKGFRGPRNFGFLHANSKQLLALLQEWLKLNPIKTLIALAIRPQIKCPCCGGAMKIVKTRIPTLSALGLAPSG